MTTDVFGYLYAATIAAGGVFGYVKAGSIPSLSAGLAFGAILGIGAHMNSQHSPKPLVQLGASLVLAGVMGAKFARTGKIMPPGAICLLSCAAVIRNLVVYHNQLPFLKGN